MIREYKYQPQAVLPICPVCGKPLGIEEWKDYGMHLFCTEYYKSTHSTEKKRQLSRSQVK